MILKPEQPAREPVPNAGFETICCHYAEDPSRQRGAASPAIYQTSTFIYPDPEAFEGRRSPESPHYDYTRCGNPTTAILEAKLAHLERGRWAFCFGSGMGAVSAAINACVHNGSHVVALAHVYGPTQTYLSHLQRFGVQTTFVNSREPEQILAAVRPETKLVYLESPTSGHMELVPLAPIAAVCRERGIRTIFDNSWATPYFQTPLDQGMDLVVHSATKYLNGHSDVVAGVVAGRDDDLQKRLAREVEYCGATLDPFAAWLMIRGLRTLAVRMEQHQRSGLAVARALEQHRNVARVNHCGLASHPQHALAREQMRGFSGLLSFVPREQSREATYRIMKRMRLFRIGVSWGGFESLCVGGTFFSAADDRKEWMIRLSAGLESTDDLVADAVQALED